MPEIVPLEFSHCASLGRFVSLFLEIVVDHRSRGRLAHPRHHDRLAVGENEFAKDKVLQLSDISWPGVRQQPWDHIGVQALRRSLVLGGKALEEMLGKQHHVMPTLAQWWHDH